MNKVTGLLKKYLGIDDNLGKSVPKSSEKWKELALELNKEVQELRGLYAKALDDVIRLKRICECQRELLAERRIEGLTNGKK